MDMASKEDLRAILTRIDGHGYLPYKAGNLGMPWIFEVAGAMNRMRTLKIK
jgi:hypothetical protein